MSDNWVVATLEDALSSWNDKLAEIWTLLTQSPENFKGGAIWSVMTNINGGLRAIGYGLLVLFFAAGLVKTCGSFTDMKKPEHVVKAFIRVALAQGAVMSGMELLTAIFSIVQGIVANIMSHSGMAGGTVTELPSEIVDKIEAVGMLESIPLWIVTLLGSLLITVLSFVMILTVYGRMFKLYMYTAFLQGESFILLMRLYKRGSYNMIKAKKIKTAIITHTKEFLSDESGMEFLQLAIVIVIVAGLIVVMQRLGKAIYSKIGGAADQVEGMDTNLDSGNSGGGN